MGIGLSFMALGLLGLSVTYIDTSGAIEVPGQIVAVAPPRRSVESVHVLVRTSDARVAVWAGTSSDKIGDFSVGQSVTLLVKPGHEAEVGVGSGRYTGGLVAIIGGLVPFMVGYVLWRSREREAPQPP